MALLFLTHWGAICLLYCFFLPLGSFPIIVYVLEIFWPVAAKVTVTKYSALVSTVFPFTCVRYFLGTAALEEERTLGGLQLARHHGLQLVLGGPVPPES